MHRCRQLATVCGYGSGFTPAASRNDETSRLARGLEHGGIERRAGLLARPDHELKCREIALAGLERRGQQRLALLTRRLESAGEHQRVTEHHHAIVGPEIEMTDPELLIDQ